MGQLLTTIWDKFNTKRESKLLMVGLDSAGKTTLLYRMKIGNGFDSIRTVPTIGFNVEEYSYKNLKMSIWDVGGQDKIRMQWKHFYNNTSGVIFVIDSQDEERMEIVSRELEYLITDDQLINVPFLIYANKQDVAQMSVSQIHQYLNSRNNLKNRKYLVQGCSAVTGDGIYEGLDWLSKQINNNSKY